MLLHRLCLRPFPWPRFIRSWLARAGLASLASAGGAAPLAGATPAEPPKLAVVIVVDQLRGDYLTRFRPHFSSDGFERFLAQGAVYANAHYRHALTATAPGHATLLTGVHANQHGIIGNSWHDPATLQSHGAVSDAQVRPVGLAAENLGPGGVWAARLGASPHRLLATTVGDQLKLRHGQRSRVLALGHKDRSPIMMAGRLADGAYWIHEDRFITSTYYRQTLPEWLQHFNEERKIPQVFGTTWERLLPAAAYDAIQGPDEAPGEEQPHGLGATFPRRIDGGATEIGRSFFEAFRLTPAADEALAELAERAVAAEGLGRRDVPDLLCLGFSTLDHTGHSYGPDSHEVMDVVLRLDRTLARFFRFLDREVGAGRYVVVLSADHGVAPLPERIEAFDRGLTAGRLDPAALRTVIDQAMAERFGPLPADRVWLVRDGYGYRLQAETLAEKGVGRAEAAVVVKQALLDSGQIAVAWTRDELLGDSVPADTPHLASWRLSYHAERGPDVVFSAHPYIVDRQPDGTNHGTPYHYDTHVPLAWFGTGVPVLVETERVGTDALAPTLCGLLGVSPPPEALAPRLF